MPEPLGMQQGMIMGNMNQSNLRQVQVQNNMNQGPRYGPQSITGDLYRSPQQQQQSMHNNLATSLNSCSQRDPSTSRFNQEFDIQGNLVGDNKFSSQRYTDFNRQFLDTNQLVSKVENPSSDDLLTLLLKSGDDLSFGNMKSS